MLEPMTSEGSRSGVNWIRRNEQSILAARARASRVLPTPGTSSISTCPSASRATTASLITSALPRTTRPTLSRSRFERLSRSSRVEDAGSKVWGEFMRYAQAGVQLPWDGIEEGHSINHDRTLSNAGLNAEIGSRNVLWRQVLAPTGAAPAGRG